MTISIGADAPAATALTPVARHPAFPLKRPGLFAVTLILTAVAIYFAFLTPSIASLSIRIFGVDPTGKALGLSTVILIGALISVVMLPLFGSLSDRTRGRFGRRRPWLPGAPLPGSVCSRTAPPRSGSGGTASTKARSGVRSTTTAKPPSCPSSTRRWQAFGSPNTPLPTRQPTVRSRSHLSPAADSTGHRHHCRPLRACCPLHGASSTATSSSTFRSRPEPVPASNCRTGQFWRQKAVSGPSAFHFI